MEKETKQEHIELYLTGTLSGQELANFEQLLQEPSKTARSPTVSTPNTTFRDW